MATPYEQKFSEFIKLCSEAKEDEVVLIHHPAVLGDSYEEIIESLRRLARSGATLKILTGE